MNKYTISAQYVGIILLAEIVTIFLSLINLIFPSLLPSVASFIFNTGIWAAQLYALKQLSDRFFNDFLYPTACIIANFIISLVILFIPNSTETGGLLTFMGGSAMALQVAANFLIMSAFIKLSRELGQEGIAIQLNISRIVYLVLLWVRILLITITLGQVVLGILEILLIAFNGYIAYMYSNLFKAMNNYRERF